jgi:hypothetical protein
MRKTIPVITITLLLFAASAVAQSVEFIEKTVEKFGYAVTLPKEFSLDGTISDTTAWTYRPEPAAGTSGATIEKGPVLTIWVNRAPVETKNLAGLYEIDKKLALDSANAPNPTIRDLRELAIAGGNAYWYKEIDKADRAANHRWIARIFGNGGVYTVSLAGPFGEFATWGPVFERVITSFVLIPPKAR